jgi:hypothetical protein
VCGRDEAGKSEAVVEGDDHGGELVLSLSCTMPVFSGCSTPRQSSATVASAFLPTLPLPYDEGGGDVCGRLRVPVCADASQREVKGWYPSLCRRNGLQGGGDVVGTLCTEPATQRRDKMRSMYFEAVGAD